MAEAQFDLCFDSDWDSSGSTKDPNYDPKSDDDLECDVAVEEESRKKKKFTKKRKKAPEDDPASGGDNPRKLQRIRLENLDASTSEYLEKNQPANSRSAVQTAMNAFKQVISEIHPEDKESFEEMEIDKLVDYLELFFKCVVKQGGKSLNASSLQTYYCSLRRYFVEKRQLDIKTDMKFSRVSKVLARRQEESMKEGEIPGKHAL